MKLKTRKIGKKEMKQKADSFKRSVKLTNLWQN